MTRDLAHAWRALRKTPAFTAGALLTIALTVGATTAIWSVVYAVLLRQLPYRDVDSVLWVWSDLAGRDRMPFNRPDFLDYRERAHTLAGLAGFFSYGASLADEAAGERVQGLRATGNFFDVLGARARLGRLLQPADEEPGSPAVVVLTEPLWRRRFGGDPGVVGRTVRLNGEEHTVIGVLAPGFATPIRDVELVVAFDPESDPRRAARNSLNFVQAVARLGTGVDATAAEGELDAIARDLRERYPVENATKQGVRMVRSIDGIAGPIRSSLLTLFASVGAVLLIACANLGNLMLVRANGRRKEIAIQLALGSPRFAVARRFFAEAIAIGIAGGALGLLLARFGVAALAALAPAELPRVGEVRIDATVLGFALAGSLLTAALFGTAPALFLARVDPRAALADNTRGTTAGGRRVRGTLVASEVALAIALLVVMTLFAKSFAQVQAVAPGFDPERVLSARLTLAPKRFADRASIVRFERALEVRVRSLPGVVETGAITLPPLAASAARVPFTVEGRVIERERVPLAQFRFVSPGYFETLRIPLERGRTFDDRDTEHTAPVAVVNRALAESWLDGIDPVGARLLIDDSDGPARPVEVVGVVGNVAQLALDGKEPTWDLYLVYPQIHPDTVSGAVSNLHWMVRTSGDPMAVADAFVDELRAVDPEVVASQVRRFEESLSDALAPRRWSVSLMAVFGAAALVLAVTGIYAVILYAVSERRREIGIRIALGARPSHVTRLVLREGAVSIGAGLAAGLALGAVALRLVRASLFGIGSSDPITFVQVLATVALASVIACLAPAVRALRAGANALNGE